MLAYHVIPVGDRSAADLFVLVFEASRSGEVMIVSVPMKKYHIYLDQLNFSSILQEDFLGHLKLARLPSEVVRFW